MGLSEQNGLYVRAARWYDEWVAGRDPGVPGVRVRHLRRRRIRPRQIKRWHEAALGTGGETEASRPSLPSGARRDTMKRDVIDTLSRHFRCLGKEITCARVRPFLPGLLLSAEPVRIPTPITVHLDHCLQCADDLQALRDLDLTEEQLERLEELYRREQAGTDSNLDSSSFVSRGVARLGALCRHLEEKRRCRRARPWIPVFVDGGIDEIDGEILDHLSTCPRCRALVHDARRELLERQEATFWPPPGCCAGVCDENVPTAELFDYAIPYDWEGTTLESADVADTGIAPGQVRLCRACLQRIQELAGTLYGIAARADSGVTTIYHTVDPDAPDQADCEPQPIVQGPSHGDTPDGPDAIDPTAPGDRADRYARYPIRVQVFHALPQPAAAESPRSRLACNPQVRLLLRTAIAAAAVIPLALLLVRTSTASGITLAQMFRALAKAENVYVATFDVPTGRLVREHWISRPANLVLTATPQERTLYDLGAKKKYALAAPGEPAETMALDERGYAGCRRLMDACLGFAQNDIPHDAKWTHVSGTEKIETYELTYLERGSAGVAFSRRWRIALDSSNQRPKALEAFWRVSPQDDWKGAQRTEIRYLAEEEAKTVFEAQAIPWRR
jgi:hypothetical protein